MPLFNKKNSKASSPTNATITNDQQPQQIVPSPIKQSTLPPPSLVFHVQLANGSPTGLICGFSSVKELYQKIAECYDIPVDEVINKISVQKPLLNSIRTQSSYVLNLLQKVSLQIYYCLK